MNFPNSKVSPVGLTLILVILALSACAREATQQESPVTSQAEQATGATEQSTSGAALTLEKINLNDMTRDELLDTIPDFGSRMVREFFEYQPYVSIQQFRREIGKYVDDAQVAFYEQYIYVPVSVNDSDAETLKQIPGVDDTIAESLMAARPFASNDAFLTSLSEYLEKEQLEAARLFLKE